ncbi:hypothetical protein PDENDC454_22319 [Paenibacillus dendritiformis C454]|uniref:Uncharacterized protein n=1 Tax=Paenibacillus dendritiformis C454 TaxID=1131935 RepID=H3SLM7_9BACL|nr:hypothetical protein PDENDC454_22319 [Paenibacillus dendritiformis C454]PZM62199.1 hypothetical protein DOE73_28540 [Paenibacillus dendritiformis]
MDIFGFIYTFLAGVLFLTVGMIASFPPPRLPWFIRIMMLCIGIAFVFYSIMSILDLIFLF